jgi:tRNA (guanine-N7-)-methyltransferase
MGSGQARALAELGPRFVLPYAPSVVHFARSFGRSAPLVLDIGFGIGDATAAIAQSMPDNDLIGVEVQPPGVGALLKRICETGSTNVRIIQHDAVDLLQSMLAPDSLAGAHRVATREDHHQAPVQGLAAARASSTAHRNIRQFAMRLDSSSWLPDQ